MKKYVALAVCICIIQASVHAQSSQSPVKQPATQSQDSPGKQKASKNKALGKNLGLSKEQSQKMNGYKKDAKKRKAEIMNDKNLSEQQKETALKSLKKENKAKMKSVLTAEQKAKLKEMKKNPSRKNPAPPDTGKEAAN